MDTNMSDSEKMKMKRWIYEYLLNRDVRFHNDFIQARNNYWRVPEQDEIVSMLITYIRYDTFLRIRGELLALCNML